MDQAKKEFEKAVDGYFEKTSRARWGRKIGGALFYLGVGWWMAAALSHWWRGEIVGVGIEWLGLGMQFIADREKSGAKKDIEVEVKKFGEALKKHAHDTESKNQNKPGAESQGGAKEA